VAKNRAIVLGAGIQGVSVALGLQQRGFAVVLVDKASDCLLRASFRNEGKIHMGFVYANDPSFKTSTLMLRASLSFSRLLDEWTGREIDWRALSSHPFMYVIARTSMVAPDRLLQSYEKLQHEYRTVLKQEGGSYLGQRPASIWEPLSADHLKAWINEKFAVCGVQTVETSLELEGFRRIMRAALARSGAIEPCFGCSVESVTRTAHGFRVEGSRADGMTWDRHADIVVNCLWDGRLKLDEHMGIRPERKWVYRLKYRLLGTLPREFEGMPSLTVVLGPYGDVVMYPHAKTYISWYPACMRGWTDGVSVPQEWERHCAGWVEDTEASRIAQDALAGFEQVVTGIAQADIDVVDAGVIFSWGKTDIDDPGSELHERFHVGVHCYDGYFSIDTGKFTCAPLFAKQFLDCVC
jgi:glycine/D-amino acid oxidase-like deaminating enzyme